MLSMKTHNEIEYNYFKYPNDEVYITVGINFGNATKHFRIDEEEEFDNNLAACNIFANYLKDENMQNIHVIVDRTVTFFAYTSNKKNMSSDILCILEKIFELELEHEKFMDIKEQTIENFKRVYKNGEFRAMYKAYEFSDLNKTYKLKALKQNLEEIDYTSFQKICSKIVCPVNSFMYVNGNLSDLQDDTLVKIDEILGKGPTSVCLGGRGVNPYIRGDAHILELSREQQNLDILHFSFPTNSGMLDRYIYLNVEAAKLPYNNKHIHLDAFDASIIVNQGELMKLKNFFRNILSEQQFDKRKQELISQFAFYLEKNPREFAHLYATLKACHISITKYYDILSNLNYKEYVDVISSMQPIIIEAQIVMRR